MAARPAPSLRPAHARPKSARTRGRARPKPPASNGPSGGQGIALRGRRSRTDHSSTGPAGSSPRSSTNRSIWWTSCRLLLALAGGEGSPTSASTANIWPTLAEGKPVSRRRLLINVEPFSGAICKGTGSSCKMATLAGGQDRALRSVADPGEKNNVAASIRILSRSRMHACRLRERTEAERVDQGATFLGAQGKTVFDPDFDIDDAGLPREAGHTPVMSRSPWRGA